MEMGSQKVKNDSFRFLTLYLIILKSCICTCGNSTVGISVCQRRGGKVLVSRPKVLVMHQHCRTQWMAKNKVPISIWGLPIWKWGGRQNNSHLGTPHFHMVFVTIWGLTYTQALCIWLHIPTTLVVMCSSVMMCRQIHVLFHLFSLPFDATIILNPH